jgi:hypothetical protein
MLFVSSEYCKHTRFFVGFCIWLILIDRTRLTAINRSLPDVNCAKQIFFSVLNPIETYGSRLLVPNNSSFLSSSVKYKLIESPTNRLIEGPDV